jgi:heterodisulfide reductase subunit A
MKGANLGIFICDCGEQISSSLDLNRIQERISDIPGVRCAQRLHYSCSENGLAAIRDVIETYEVERVLVAGCTARTMEPLFKETCESAGLSGDRFELVDIREGCAWVHQSDPEAATSKAEDLIRMGVARVSYRNPRTEVSVEIEPTALVIGGGLAGMTAAINLADANVPVKLVERESALGGMLRDAHTLYPQQQTASEYLNEKIEAVTHHPHIEVLLEKEINEISGTAGRYSVVANGKASNDDGSLSFDVGAIIVATGAREARPDGLYQYDGKHVVTQLEFEREIHEAANESHQLPDRVVMILCAGQRDNTVPHCSNFCCMASLKQAMELKAAKPNAEVAILFRDIYLLGDSLYENELFKAVQSGVKFMRYEPSNPPEVNDGIVVVQDELTGLVNRLPYDRIVLATPLVPQRDSGTVAHLLNTPQDEFGFFPEIRHRLKPEDSPSQGIFVCGAAHFPVDWGQAEFQATSTAFNVLNHLSQGEVSGNANMVGVDEQLCTGCGTCVDVCPFSAISMCTREGLLDLSEIDPMLCAGCGNCVVACPVKAIHPTLDSDPQIYAQIEEALTSASHDDDPRILTFGCEWSSHAAAELAGAKKLAYPVIVRPIQTRCSARFDPLHVLWAFLHGADGVFLGVCPPGKCHYGNGNEHAHNRIKNLYSQLEMGGFDRRRLRFEYIQPDNPDDYAQKLTNFSNLVCNLRPKVSLVKSKGYGEQHVN